MFTISSSSNSSNNPKKKLATRGNSIDIDDDEAILGLPFETASTSSSSSSSSSASSVIEVNVDANNAISILFNEDSSSSNSSSSTSESVIQNTSEAASSNASSSSDQAVMAGASLDSQDLSPPLQTRDAAKMQRRRKKKKRLAESLSTTTFKDIYYLTGDVLGEGSYGRVETCINQFTDVEYAVKIISKKNWCFSRSKVLKEVELYYLCQGQKEIIQLVEYFEEQEYFYLIFEKAHGGPLLSQIQRRVKFTEEEAASIVRDLAKSLLFLHERGIAHRDLKPENILCVSDNSPLPVKLCDFDLCSSVNQSLSTPLLQSPVGSAEYMAPEVVNAFSLIDDYFDDDLEDELTYDKKCDLWSLGVITYILLCGYLPFSGRCDRGGDCGWEKGGECQQCQTSLFNAIKGNQLIFPDEHWAGVSKEAKDLISSLLVKEASGRLDAAGILRHPWIVGGGNAQKSLETPVVLRRQVSVKEILSAFQFQNTMKRSATELAFNNAAGGMSSPMAIPGNRKISAQMYRKMSRTNNAANMRRQTSLIFPTAPDINNCNSNALFNRCEY